MLSVPQYLWNQKPVAIKILLAGNIKKKFTKLKFQKKTFEKLLIAAKRNFQRKQFFYWGKIFEVQVNEIRKQ